MRKCPICKQKYEPKYSSIEPCSNYECRLVLYERANKKLKAQSDKEKREKDRAARLVKKQMKNKLLTKSDYEKFLQKEINLICRLLDKGHPCISSGRSLGKNYDAGHFRSRGSAPTIRFHMINIWAQSVEQNQYKSGNPVGYIEGLKSLYGLELVEEVISLKSKFPSLNLSIDEIQEATKRARIIVKELKTEDKVYSTQERLSLRREFNARIGIYQ